MNTPLIKILQPGDEPALEAFLLPRIDTSMFLLGNMQAAGLIDHGQPLEGTYAASFHNGEITGVVAHYWNRALILQAPAHIEPLCRAAAAAASKRPIGGLIGPAKQVGAAKEALNITTADLAMDETEKLYRLNLADLIVPEALRSGQCHGRRMQPADIDLIAKWRAAYAIETLGEQDSPQLHQKSRESVKRTLKSGHIWVLEKEGRLVATSGFNTALKTVVQIGGVWTPPALRRRGYGRAAVAASLRDVRAEGVEKAILFTGEGNIAAQKAYTALGFQHIGDYRMLFLAHSE